MRPTAGRAVAAFSPRQWLRTWLWTALAGTLVIVSVFVVYELVERAWLLGRVGADVLARLHLLRGIFVSVLVGSLSVYGIWRARRGYDRAYTQAYVELERENAARSSALARAQAFTERVFDALPDRMVVLDACGRVVKANRVALAAFDEDPRGRECGLFGRSCSDHCVARSAAGSKATVVGPYLRTDPRSGRIFSIEAFPVHDQDDGAPLVIECARDVTAAKNLEAQVRNQEKLAALGVLAAGIAHDIANPLASMSSELEMLEQEEDLVHVRASVGILRGQIGRITRTLREMNDFARRRGEEIGPISLVEVVEDALRMVRHDARARKVTIVKELATDLGEHRGVEDHLVMVVVNLLINAFDALPDGGTVTIRAARTPGAGVDLRVTDDGTGMTDEVRRRAIEPLFTTKPPGKGTGLGLSVSAQVMESLGGSLAIESSVGAGTTVCLHFPAEPRGTDTASGGSDA